MALMLDDPPSTLPRGQLWTEPLVPAWATVS
jgi:hypothetical protein